MQAKTQRQWQIKEKGLENLVLVNDAPILEPQGNDLLLRIYVAGLNPVDWKRCIYIFKQAGPLGLDAVGVVEAVGPNVPNTFVPGKTLVISFGSLTRQTDQGSLAQFTLTDYRYAVVIPEVLINKNIPTLYSDIAASLCPGYTAYQPKQVFFPFKRNFVITCGAGGVGAFCIQLLNYYRKSIPEEYGSQIKIITTCSAKNFDYVKGLGATHAIDYNTQDIEAEVKQLTNGVGADAWVDLVNADSAQSGLRSLAFNGELVVVVDNANYQDQLFMKAITVHNVSVGFIHFSNNPDQIVELKRLGEDFWNLMGEGAVTPIKYKEIGIEDVKQSLEDLKNNKVGTKLVMVNKFE